MIEYSTRRISNLARLWLRLRAWLVRCVILPRTSICINCDIGGKLAQLSFTASDVVIHNVNIQSQNSNTSAMALANGQLLACSMANEIEDRE